MTRIRFRISDFGLRRLIEVESEEETIGRAIEQRFDQMARIQFGAGGLQRNGSAGIDADDKPPGG
jgi:hypothetical protein